MMRAAPMILMSVLLLILNVVWPSQCSELPLPGAGAGSQNDPSDLTSHPNPNPNPNPNPICVGGKCSPSTLGQAGGKALFMLQKGYLTMRMSEEFDEPAQDVHTALLQVQEETRAWKAEAKKAHAMLQASSVGNTSIAHDDGADSVATWKDIDRALSDIAVNLKIA